MSFLILNFAEARQPEYKEKRGVGYIEYGDKNDYPLYLLSLFNKSAKHSAIIKGKVNYIIGNGWSGDLPSAQAFIDSPNQYDSLDELTRKVCLDIEIFGGCYLECVWSMVGGQLASVSHIDYSKVRTNKDNTQFWIKNNWLERKEVAEVLPAFNDKQPQGKQVMYIKEYRPNLNTYSLPNYYGCLNYIESDIEVSKQVLGNAMTGFSASKLITLPNGEPSNEEKRDIERRFSDRFSGADGKKFILSFVNDTGRKPIVDDLGASDLTKEDFSTVDAMIQQNIFAGHQITAPSLFGIAEPGKLGGRNEMRDAYEIFKNTYANDKQRFLEELFNYLLLFRGGGEIKILPVEPIGLDLGQQYVIDNLTKEEI